MLVTKKDFASFLESRRADMGLTQEKMTQFLKEKGLELSRRTYQNWENGATMPPGEVATDVIEALGGMELLAEEFSRKAPGSWIERNEVSRSEEEEPDYPAHLPEETPTFLFNDPYSKELPAKRSHWRAPSGHYYARQFGQVSAGAGRVSMGVTDVQLYRPPEYRARFGEHHPRDVGEFEIVGDSAVPEYYHGERVPVLLHRGGRHQFKQDTKYVFRWDQDLMLKRLRLLQDGRIRALSLNPGIDPFYIELHGEYDFEVLALVLESQKQQLYSALCGRFLQTGEVGFDF